MLREVRATVQIVRTRLHTVHDLLLANVDIDMCDKPKKTKAKSVEGITEQINDVFFVAALFLSR